MRIWLLVLAACASAPRPLAPPPPPEPTAPAPPVAALEPEPAVDVSVDVDSLLHARAPELAPPSIALEPHYAIADAYGVATWRDACESRGRPRTRADIDELATYLAAWCGDDRDRTAHTLASLVHARTPGMAASVRADLLVLVTNLYDHVEALRWFDRAGMPVSHEEVAALYDALDRPGEVVALLSDAHGPVTTDCIQLARLASADVHFRELAVAELHAPGEACREAAAFVLCPIVTGRREPGRLLAPVIRQEATTCAPIVGAEAAYAIALRDRWPQTRDSQVWLDYLLGAADAPHTPQLDALRRAALANAVRTSACTPRELSDLVVTARTIDPSAPEMTEQSCRASR